MAVETVVAECLPSFLSSIALAAFHPVIRLAYGVTFSSDAETAAALAYLVSMHQDFPLDETPVDLEAAMAAQVEAPAVTFSSNRFGTSIRELRDAGAWPVGQATLDECAGVSLAVYRATRNFFALHMVTASQAVRSLVPFVDEGLAARVNRQPAGGAPGGRQPGV